MKLLLSDVTTSNPEGSFPLNVKMMETGRIANAAALWTQCPSKSCQYWPLDLWGLLLR